MGLLHPPQSFILTLLHRNNSETIERNELNEALTSPHGSPFGRRIISFRRTFYLRVIFANEERERERDRETEWRNCRHAARWRLFSLGCCSLLRRGTRARESAGIIAATINGGATPLLFLGARRGEARARVYLVSDLHRSPISGLCSKYT